MISAVKSLSSNLSNGIKNQGVTIASGIIIVSTSLVNYFLESSFFKCPSASHVEYGMCFLLLPGLILALLTLLASARLSTTLAGCCLNDVDAPGDALFGKRKRTIQSIIRNISIAFVMAALSFFCWVIISLITTEAYVCIVVGPFDKSKMAQADYKKLVDGQKATSVKLGLIILVICLFLLLVINLVMRCCYSDVPEKELPSMRRFDKIEADAANDEFKKLLKDSAMARGKEIVQECLNMYHQQNNVQDKESVQKEVIPRDGMEKIRLFFASRYPRLDGAKQLEYCIHSVVPENFDFAFDQTASIEDIEEGGTPLKYTSYVTE